jgi:hypothetical protein
MKQRHEALNVVKKLFTEHPDTVGESYFGHMGQAMSFAIDMFVGSIACLLHAFFPFLCEKTGSKAITRLHKRMVTHRDRRKMPGDALPE